MKKTSLLVFLVSALLPVQAFFLFQPIIEISYDVSDSNATLAMLAGKKYRIKFYNLDCPDCKTVIKPGPKLEGQINIRTELKRVGSNSLTTHHVIDVPKLQEPIQGKLYLEAIHGTFARTIPVDINTMEACKLQD